MTASVTYRVRFGTEPAQPVDEPEQTAGERDEPAAVIPGGYASTTARFLAIAHAIEARLRDGTLRDYAHAGAWLGISTARANMLSHLVHLAPEIQEAILLGQNSASEHRLREVAREPIWAEQRRAV